MTYFPNATSIAPVLQTVSNTYTASGAISTSDSLAVVNASAAVAMTLANGTVDGRAIIIKRLGGAVTLRATIDGSAATLTLNSPNGGEAVELVWNAALASYVQVRFMDTGWRVTDLPAAGALSGTDASVVTQSGTDGQVTLGAQAAFVLQQELPSVTLAADTTLARVLHHRRTLFCSGALTLSGAAATVGDGFECRVVNTGTGLVTLGSGITALSGTSTLAAGGSLSLLAGASAIYAVGSGAAAVASPTLSIGGITGQTPGGTSTATGAFANGAPASLTATSDGAALTLSGVSVNTVSGSGSSAAGTWSASFTSPAAGTHAIVFAGTGTYAAISAAYSLTTTAAPALTITAVTPAGVGITATASGTFANGAPAGLTATMDGAALGIAGVAITTSSGTGAAAAGTFSFTFTNPAAGAHSLAAAGTGTYAASSAAYGYTTAAPALTVNTITTPAANTAFPVSGTYANFVPSGIQYSADGGTSWTTALATISGGSYSFAIAAGLPAGTYAVMVRAATYTSVQAASNAFTIAAAAAQAVTVDTPVNKQVGATFTVTGTYANGTPAALDSSWDNSTWTAVSAPTIGSGVFSFGVTAPGTVNLAQVIYVRDRSTGVQGASGPFQVNSCAITVTSATVAAGSGITGSYTQAVAAYNYIALYDVTLGQEQLQNYGGRTTTVNGTSAAFSATPSGSAWGYQPHIGGHTYKLRIMSTSAKDTGTVMAESVPFTAAAQGSNAYTLRVASGGTAPANINLAGAASAQIPAANMVVLTSGGVGPKMLRWALSRSSTTAPVARTDYGNARQTDFAFGSVVSQAAGTWSITATANFQVYRNGPAGNETHATGTSETYYLWAIPLDNSGPPAVYTDSGNNPVGITVTY